MLTGTDAAILLPFVLPIAGWVAWSDMKAMRIPNKAVLALASVFLVLGLFLLPFTQYLWALGLLVAVLAVGFAMTNFGMMGAGDAKFGAAMAPFFIGADVRLALGLLAASLLGAFAAHRLLRAIPFVRSATPGWVSWTHHKFPMGLALAGTLLIYLAYLVHTDFVN